MPIGNLRKKLLYGQPKSAGERMVERKVKVLPAASEILLNFLCRSIQALWCFQNPRANMRCEPIKHRVEVFAPKSNAYKTRLRCRQQEGAHRGVNVAIRNIQEPQALSIEHQPRVKLI